MWRRRRTGKGTAVVVLGVLVATAGAAGCSDDDGGGPGAGGGEGRSALVEPFGEAAEDAYAAGDSDRGEDFNRGVMVDDGCFVLDDEGAAAVAEALGLDDPSSVEMAEGTYLNGPPGQREVLTCSVDVGERTLGVSAGTILLDRDELLEEAELYAGQNDEEVAVIDGEAPGLDADTVLAIDRDGFASFTWVAGDFHVTLTLPEQVADYDRGFEALPVLVDAVSEALGAG